MFPASTTISTPSGSAASSTAIASRYRTPSPSCAGGCSSVLSHRVRHPHTRRPAVAVQRLREQSQRSAEVLGLDMRARHERRSATRSSTSAPMPAHRPVPRARSRSTGCRPPGRARCRRSPWRPRDVPSRRSPRALRTTRGPACPRHPWHRGRWRCGPAASSAARASSARASSRATCSPAMIVIGPSARRSARAIACGSPSAARLPPLERPFTEPVMSRLDCWMSFGSSSTAGPPRLAAAMASGNAVVMSSGVEHASAEHRHRGEQRLAVQCTVSAAGVLEGAAAVERRRRLADQRQHRNPAGQRLTQAGNGIQTATARSRGDDAQTGAAAAVAVGHRRRGELVLGQYGGDVVVEVRGIVEILDVGAVDAEDVFDAGRRQIADDVVDNPMRSGHSFTCFRTCK